MSEFTLMVKTIARPDCLERLLVSVRKFYPDMPVVVTDDSKEPYPEVSQRLGYLNHHVMPFDTSAPACYNFMLERIQTRYMILADDDMIFTEDTRIDLWVPFLNAGIFDVLGGAVKARRNGSYANYVGDLTFENSGRRLILRRKVADARKITVPLKADVCMNFFGAKTDRIRMCPWDGDLKIYRHLDWFMTAKEVGLKVGYHPGVEAIHDHRPGLPYYMELRHGRIPDGKQQFMDKRGLTEVID